MASGGQNLEIYFLLDGVALKRKAYSFRPKLTHNDGVNQATPEDVIPVVFHFVSHFSSPRYHLHTTKLTFLKY